MRTDQHTVQVHLQPQHNLDRVPRSPERESGQGPKRAARQWLGTGDVWDLHLLRHLDVDAMLVVLPRSAEALDPVPIELLANPLPLLGQSRQVEPGRVVHDERLLEAPGRFPAFESFEAKHPRARDRGRKREPGRRDSTRRGRDFLAPKIDLSRLEMQGGASFEKNLAGTRAGHAYLKRDRTIRQERLPGRRGVQSDRRGPPSVLQVIGCLLHLVFDRLGAADWYLRRRRENDIDGEPVRRSS